MTTCFLNLNQKVSAERKELKADVKLNNTDSV